MGVIVLFGVSKGTSEQSRHPGWIPDSLTLTPLFPFILSVAKRSPPCRINDIDGVRVTSEDGWWLLRASNTQAALAARCEARDEAALSRVRSALEAELARSGTRLPG